MHSLRQFFNKKILILLTLTSLIGGFFATNLFAAPEDPQVAREYYLKAAFLRYVVKYVDWPESTLPDLSYNLCVLGDVPSFKGINSINGKQVKDRTIIVQPINTAEQAKQNCQVLLVAPDKAKEMAPIIQDLKDSKVLTFGDFDNFAKNGGDMNFFIMNNRMAIMINPPAVYEKGLKISDKMLRLVSIVPQLDPEDMILPPGESAPKPAAAAPTS